MIGVQIDGQTLTVLVGSLSGVGALVAARYNRTKGLFDEHHWLYEQALKRIEQLEQKVRDLTTEAEKWRRRAQEWRSVNGEDPWPE